MKVKVLLNNINKNKVCKIAGITFFFILLAVIYFQYPMMVMPDSTEYYGYLKIFYGKEPFSSWNIVRGPSYPLVLFFITILFGNNQVGLLIGTFILYCIMIIICFGFIKKINFRNKFEMVVCYLLFIFGIAFNPMILGYMHSLLTEFVAIPMFIFSVFLSIKWIEKNQKLKNQIIISIILIIDAVFMWFVKQPYVFIAIGPIIVSGIIAIFEDHHKRNIIYRLGVIGASIIFVFIGMQIWNLILVKNNVDNSTGRDTDSFIKLAIINGNTMFSIDSYDSHYEKEYIVNSELISNEDKEEILKIFDNNSEYKSFKLINVFNNFSSRDEENISKKIVMFSKENEYTTGDSLKMYGRLIKKYPIKTIKSYIANYLAIGDIVACVRHKDANEYYPSMNDGFYYENQSIGYSIYYCENNMLWLSEEHYLYDNVKNLKTSNNSSKRINKLIYNEFGAVNFIFKLTIISVPILFIALIVAIVVTHKKKRKNKNLKIALVFIGSALIHLIFHAITGAIIDRYAIPIWLGCIVAIFITAFEKYDVIEHDNL